MSQAPLFQQPENLTKERLKAELKKHGVAFDQNENKDYYVRLYRSNVNRPAGRRQRSEFSSDEELVRRSPRFGARKPTKTASQSSYMARVSQLTDEELAEELRKHGEDPGPIMETTRGVYQRKLAKLMAEKTKVASRTREKETTDYATDQLGEWSSQSSEGDTDTEEEQGDEEEGEEEAGAMEEPSPMRLRSHSAHAKSQRMAYVSYSTPTRYVESSYLLRKPKDDRVLEKPREGDAGVRVTGAEQSSHAKVRDSRRPPADQPSHPATTAAAPTVWSSILSCALLVVVFAIIFFAYDHYTSESSLVTRAVSYLPQLLKNTTD